MMNDKDQPAQENQSANNDGASVANLYVFDFIISTLNLVPICNGDAAINIGAITDIRRSEEDQSQWIFSLHGGDEYALSADDMRELEENLKRRIEDNKAQQKIAMMDQAKMQIEIAAELQGGVQPGGMIINAPQSKRFRQ